MHAASFRFETPRIGYYGLGVEYDIFERQSRYYFNEPGLPPGVTQSQLIKQTNPQLRLYVTICPSVRHHVEAIPLR